MLLLGLLLLCRVAVAVEVVEVLVLYWDRVGAVVVGEDRRLLLGSFRS